MPDNIRAILKGAATNCPPGVSFAKDIAPLFTANDISHMKQVTGGSLDLSSYASVKIWAAKILSEVSSGNMPPPPEAQWTPAMVNTFACWIQQGSQP